MNDDESDASSASTVQPKTVGFYGGFSLLFGSMTGPGLLTIPLLFQQAGWFVPTLAFLTYGTLSCISSLEVCEVISRMPGNELFQEVVEVALL